jgi:glycosyltransferase involved in cell wall biosynthesis
MAQQMTPFVSVIIPVFNDARSLKICLDALEYQTYPQSHYEVIVVDNDSVDQGAIETVVAKFQQAVLVHESISGSYAARNKGITVAKGEILAFTDADCVPATNWIEQGVKHWLATPNCGLVAGKIELFFQSPNLTLVEWYERLTAFDQRETLMQYRGCATANLFTARSVMEAIGKFDASLKSGGDFEWAKRVYAHGYQQVYADEVCVAHPARSSLSQLQKKTRRIAGGIYDLYVARETVLIRKQKAFLRVLYDDLVATFNSILAFSVQTKIDDYKLKIKLIFVILYVGYFSMIEKITLKLGGISSRA